MILRRFMHRTKKDEGRAEEIDSHLAHEQDAHAARGLSHQEARRQPHLRFGNPRGTRERVWRYRSFPCVEEGWRDLRFDRAPRFLASFLFGVKAWDPIAFIVTPVLLSAVALFAVWIPAKRATSVDPMTALRLE